MDITDSLSASSSQLVDNMLKALVAVPEKSQLELGITLNVSGLLITGYIISQNKYFEELVRRLEDTSSNNDVKSSLSDFITQLGEKLNQTGSDVAKLPDFIHLRDVKIYPSEGKGMPTYGQALWRGKLPSIDGFSLGEMIPAQFETISRST